MRENVGMEIPIENEGVTAVVVIGAVGSQQCVCVCASHVCIYVCACVRVCTYVRTYQGMVVSMKELLTVSAVCGDVVICRYSYL